MKMKTARAHRSSPFVAAPVPHHLAMLHILGGALPFRFVLADGPRRAPRLRAVPPQRRRAA